MNRSHGAGHHPYHSHHESPPVVEEDGGGYAELPSEALTELGEMDSLNPYLQEKKNVWSLYFPVLGWLPAYERNNLVWDLISGFTTGAMIIPQALAYSLLAGLPPQMGLYTAFFALLVYFVMGQCGQLSIGPDAMTAMLVGSFLNSLSNNNVMAGLSLVTMANGLALISGVFLALLGMFKFGFIDNILSKSVLRGFVTAVAFIIMIEQLPALMGVSAPPSEEPSYLKLMSAYQHIDQVKVINLGVGVASILFLLFLSLLKRFMPWTVYIPGILILVITGMTMAYTLDLPNSELPLLGKMGAGGFHLPHLPGVFSMQLHQASLLLNAAVVVSVVGFVESIVIAKEFSVKHHYQVSSNTELLALGTANIVASCFGSFPTFGSLPRSGVANATGAKTPLAGLVTAAILGLCIQFLIPWFAYMPRVIMAAVIFRASLLLIEEHEIMFILKVRSWSDTLIMLVMGILTLLLGIEKGIVIGIAISVIMVVKRTTLPRVSVLGRASNGKLRRREECDFFEPITGALVLRFEEKHLYYANIGQTRSLISHHVEEALHHLRATARDDEEEPRLSVILNMKWVEKIDASALLALETLVEELHERSIGLFIVRLNPEIRGAFLRSGLVERLGPNNICPTNETALQVAMGNRMAALDHALPA
jgi:high affinity sulfate transporter 1